MNRRAVVPLILVCAVVSACSEEDNTAPPPPNVDPVESPTGATTLELTGSAEYGATVNITGGVAPVQATADPFTARFRAEVELAPDTSNVLTLTATDASGNTSEAVTVTVVHADPAGAAVISNVRVNGTLCDPSAATPPGCTVRDGDTVSFEVVATDEDLLSEVGYSIFFPSTQTVRSRSVLITSGSSTATVPFSFSVNSDTIESADLVPTVVDSTGARQNGHAVPLHVILGIAVRDGRTFDVLTSGAPMSQPLDVAVLANADAIVLSEGNDQVLRVPSGTNFATSLATFADMEFLTAGDVPGGPERLFVSRPGDGRVFSLETDGSGLVAFADPAGNVARGLDVRSPTSARGWVDLSAAADGDTVTLGGASTEVYELDSDATCTGGGTLTCVVFSAGGTSRERTDAFVAAVDANSALVDATTATDTVAALTARTAGEAGNGISLTATGGLTVSAPQLAGGHFEELYVATEDDNFVRRYELDGGPYDAVTDHGAFDVGARQWGLAVRDVLQLDSTLLEHFVLYAPVDSGLGIGRTLRAREVRVTGTGTGTATTEASVFTVAGTNTGSVVTFGRLWDVAVTAEGCVVASDDNGRLYLLDTRDPASAAPAVSILADGLRAPRGLAFDSTGRLLVSMRDADAILRISPTPDATDCF